MNSTQTVGSVNIIKARSSLASEGLNQCRKSLDDCLAQRRSFIVLDLSASPLINSEGLEFIVDSQHRCLAEGGRLVIAASQPLAAEILQITGVADCVGVFDDMRSALSDFAK